MRFFDDKQIILSYYHDRHNSRIIRSHELIFDSFLLNYSPRNYPGCYYTAGNL